MDHHLGRQRGTQGLWVETVRDAQGEPASASWLAQLGASEVTSRTLFGVTGTPALRFDTPRGLRFDTLFGSLGSWGTGM